MRNNYDFHLHYQLVDASQMLGEFESFHCNRNVHNVCRYGKLNFPSCSSFNIGYRLLNSRKIVFAFSQKNWRKKKLKAENYCFSTASLRKPWDLCQAKSMLWSFCIKSWLDISMLWSFYVGHTPLYVTFFIRPPVAHHISGTVHHLIIIFGACV